MSSFYSKGTNGAEGKAFIEAIQEVRNYNMFRSDVVNVDGASSNADLWLHPLITGSQAEYTHADTDPGSGDDETQGYGVGSYGYNENTEKHFACLSAVETAAVWVEIPSKYVMQTATDGTEKTYTFHFVDLRPMGISDALTADPLVVADVQTAVDAVSYELLVTYDTATDKFVVTQTDTSIDTSVDGDAIDSVTITDSTWSESERDVLAAMLATVYTDKAMTILTNVESSIVTQTPDSV